ncbi:MAG: DUF5686 and carboxypeptidase regulatory-like domain-containing protein [Bacteroidota bacterium]
MGLFLVLYLFSAHLFSQPTPAYTVSGTITGPAGSPLAYASVILDESVKGTVADKNGYFSLLVPGGAHVFTVSYIGYETQKLNKTVSGNTQLNVSLKADELVLEEVVITDDGRDPAYTIIQKAIDNRKANEFPFSTFTHKAYTKTFIKFRDDFDVNDLSKFGLRVKRDSNVVTPPELQSEMIFLSENISTLSFQKPDKVKETILSSRVSGDSEQFSLAGNLFNRYNPYEARTIMRNVANRGAISPLSPSAFFHYEFKLLGTTQERGYKSYKIEMKPRRAVEPAFYGVIYIADSSYAISELDWTLYKQQMDLLDTLHIQQTYEPVKGKWLLQQSRIGFAMAFNIFGFEIPVEGITQSILSEYDVAPVVIPKFGREIIRVDDSALVQKTMYWDSIRPIPLTVAEGDDYQFMDSLEQVQLSPAYQDSLSRETRKFKAGDILGGKTIQNYRKKRSFTVDAPINNLGFNAIDGLFISLPSTISWETSNKGRWVISPTLRYAFAREKLNYELGATYESGNKLGTTFGIQAGDMVSQFSRFDQLSNFVNTYYSLFEKQSYVRLYRKKFVEAAFEKKLAVGLSASVNARYEDRTPLSNSTDYSFFKRDRVYESNIDFTPHTASILNWQIKWQPFTRFISAPNELIELSSGFPELGVEFEHTVAAPDEGDANFSKLLLHLRGQNSIPVIGTNSWRVSAGRFLNDDQVNFQDAFHFKGNETAIRGFESDQFFLMPYYRFSATDPFVEVHTEHAFSGWLLNFVPGLKQLKLKEYVGYHLLIQEDRQPYAELSFGLEKRLFDILPLRIDVNYRLSGETDSRRWFYKLIFPF